jgi:hypothetical protein
LFAITIFEKCQFDNIYHGKYTTNGHFDVITCLPCPVCPPLPLFVIKLGLTYPVSIFFGLYVKMLGRKRSLILGSKSDFDEKIIKTHARIYIITYIYLLTYVEEVIF